MLLQLDLGLGKVFILMIIAGGLLRALLRRFQPLELTAGLRGLFFAEFCRPTTDFCTVDVRCKGQRRNTVFLAYT